MSMQQLLSQMQRSPNGIGGATPQDPLEAFLTAIRRKSAYAGMGMDGLSLQQLIEIIGGGGGGGGNGGGNGGGDDTVGCLIGDVMVRMADGTEKRADEIRVDDEVMGFDFQHGSTPQTISCTNSSRQKCYRVTLSNGNSLVASSSHRWFIHKDNGHDVVLTEWILGKDLMDESGEPLEVVNLEEVGSHVVYWWNCDPNHCYFAGGVLHHNIEPDHFKGSSYSNPYNSPGGGVEMGQGGGL